VTSVNIGNTLTAKAHANIGTIVYLSIAEAETLGRSNSRDPIEDLDTHALHWRPRWTRIYAGR
jgi:hypothetical protein